MVWTEEIAGERPETYTTPETESVQRTHEPSGVGRTLGWIGVGLGLAKLVAPRWVASAIGLPDGPRARTVVRVLGLGTLAAGVTAIRASERAGTARATEITKAVTIDRRREEVFRFYRENELPDDAEIVEERTDALIAWKSTAHSSGTARFTLAPGGRGTEIHVSVRRRPLVGFELGRELHRIKQIMETGDVVHSDASIHRGKHPARPPSGPVELASSMTRGLR